MLTRAIDAFLAMVRALGFAYGRQGKRLKSFARFAAERGDDHVHAATAIEWARAARTAAERDRRLRSVVRFARYACLEDPAHELPPADLFAVPRRRPVPYLFAASEIERLLRAALELEPRASLRPFTYNALIALVACTGLRICEALRLRLEDFGTDGLVIRETKFRKSRLVPLHATARTALDRYLERRVLFAVTDDHLFLDHRARGLSYRRAEKTFRKLTVELGLRGEPGRPQPRLHGLRHTFAVRALESCPHERGQVGRHLVALSTYLGHASVVETFWYLEATPELLAGISRACETFRAEASR